MKIEEIFESKLPNSSKYRLIDTLSDISKNAKEIRQTYNKCYKNKLRSPLKKRFTLI
jgi:hypothetical protein